MATTPRIAFVVPDRPEDMWELVKRLGYDWEVVAEFNQDTHRVEGWIQIPVSESYRRARTGTICVIDKTTGLWESFNKYGCYSTNIATLTKRKQH